jgi:hypothetical protein
MERFDNDRLDGVLADRVDQAVTHGVLLQHVDSVLQIEFADGVEVRAGLTARSEHIESRYGQSLLRRIVMTRFVTVHWFAPESRPRAGSDYRMNAAGSAAIARPYLPRRVAWRGLRTWLAIQSFTVVRL